MKELEELLATRNTEVEKAAKDAAVREVQFVDHVAFLAQNVLGKYSLCLSCIAVFLCLICCIYFSLCLISIEASCFPALTNSSGDKMSLK